MGRKLPHNCRRADAQEGAFEKRGNLLTIRGLRASSRELGVSGQCDVVEFHRDKNGIELSGYDGKWGLVPIEYKHGKPKEHSAEAFFNA